MDQLELNELKRKYEKQQTHEGQEALRVKRELAERFSKMLNKPMKVGVFSALKDGRTGETTGYFIAE